MATKKLLIPKVPNDLLKDVDIELLNEIRGKMEEIAARVRAPNARRLDPRKVGAALDKILAGRFPPAEEAEEKGRLLKLLAIDNELNLTNGSLTLLPEVSGFTIGALEGKRTLHNSVRVFKGGIDDDFKRWDLNKPGLATGPTAIAVYEIAANGNFPEIFSAFRIPLKSLRFSQDQIVEICDLYALKLVGAYRGNFFLFSKDASYADTNLFVAEAEGHRDGLFAGVFHLNTPNLIWHAQCRNRLFIPKAALPLAQKIFPVIKEIIP